MARKTQFTQKQLAEMYAFLEDYIESEYRPEALKIIKGMLRYDRALMKQRLQKTWNDMLSKIDTI